MDFINSTPFEAKIMRASLLYRDLIMATVIAKCTFDIQPNGELTLAEQQEPLRDADQETPYGFMDGDVAVIKEGCDFAIFGSARPQPIGHATTEMMVEVEIGGDFARRWKVSGDRFWRKTDTGYEPSAPQPFIEMILGYRNAYGGKAIVKDQLKTAHHANPEGKGFVLREADVEGTPLPNFECANELINCWQDRPTTAGLAPPNRHSSLRGVRGYDVNLEEQTTHAQPLAFCFSHPQMLLPRYPLGERVTIRGMGHARLVQFHIPALHLYTGVALGERRTNIPLIADTLCVFPDELRVEVSARRAFIYQFVPERKRATTLCNREAHMNICPTISSARTDQAVGIAITSDDEEMLEAFDDFVAMDPLTTIVENLPVCISG